MRELSSSQISLCVLASGSKGNSIYLAGNGTSILIDAGLSGIEIERRMKSRELNPADLDAIVVSHEHSDHVYGVGVLARRYNLPVYINKGTKAAADAHLGKIKSIVDFECGRPFVVNSLKIHPFSISHDAEDPSGFTIFSNGFKIGLATDLGFATSMVKENLKGCNALVLEANHDKDMLAEGPYPWPLKQRIKSRIGHLSNEDAAELLAELLHDKLEHVVLAHLSDKNNTPKKAHDVIGALMESSRVGLSIAQQDKCGDLLVF